MAKRKQPGLKPKGVPRIRFYVGPEPGIRGMWRVTEKSPKGAARIEAGYAPKREAVKRARELVKAEQQFASVYVCGKDGRYRCEWTYPRASDPKRTKG